MHITDHDQLAAALATHDPFTQPYDDLDPEVLSAVGLLDAVVAAKRLRGHAEAFEARVYAAVEARIRAQDAGSSRGGGAFESEVGATVHLPPATLRTLIAESGFLCERFPETLAQLSKGLVTWRQVKPLLDLTSGMSDQDARAVEAKVLPELGQHTPRIVRNRIQSAIHEVDPEGAAQRHVERNKQRRFEVRPEVDGIPDFGLQHFFDCDSRSRNPGKQAAKYGRLQLESERRQVHN